MVAVVRVDLLWLLGVSGVYVARVAGGWIVAALWWGVASSGNLLWVWLLIAVGRLSVRSFFGFAATCVLSVSCCIKAVVCHTLFLAPPLFFASRFSLLVIHPS